MVLLLHHGPIECFRLISKHVCNEAIGRWMLTLSRNKIKHLHLGLDSVEKCKIPSSFFACLELERIFISNVTINVPRLFLGFKLLRTMRLFQFNLTEIELERLISGCPLLESLQLSGFVYGRLIIHAPNLRLLSIAGEFGDICLEIPKLVFANIFLDGTLGSYLDFVQPNKECGSNILRVLGSLTAIEELSLCSDFISYLAKWYIPEVLPVPFYKLTDLHVDLCCTFYEEVAAAFCLFKSAPNLTVLSLMLYQEESCQFSTLAETFLEVKEMESNLFNRLVFLKITYFEHPGSTLKLAQDVLSNAPLLEKLSIRESDISGLIDGMAFLKELASF